MNNSTYWSYNVPLQISPNYETCEEDSDTYILDDKGNKKISGYTVLILPIDESRGFHFTKAW